MIKESGLDLEKYELMRYIKIDIYQDGYYKKNYITLNLNQNNDYMDIYKILKIKAISILYVFISDNILYDVFNKIKMNEEKNIDRDKLVELLLINKINMPYNWINYDKELLIKSCVYSYIDCCHNNILEINNKLLDFLKERLKN